MTANPLALVGAHKRIGKVTIDDLEALAASLNSEWWVEHMGRHYLVGRDEHGRHQLSWQPRRVFTSGVAA